MKIISPNVELLKQEPGLEGIFKQIERAGRTCYKSEDKIDKYSARVFVERMIESKHYAMLEHGTVYLIFVINNNNRDKEVHYPWYNYNTIAKLWEVFSYVQCLFLGNKYSVVKLSQNKDYTETTMCITTNYRVIVENGWEGIMHEFISEPTLYHERRITLKFTTNIGVTREGNRHRVNSIAEESTRYCNYTKEKHGNGEINIAPPIWLDDYEHDIISERTNREWVDDIIRIAQCIGTNSDACDFPIYYYGASIVFANICYNNLIRLGWSPQQAREVLPLATKSEVVYTAFAHDWKHWFDLRLYGTTGKPHPNMFEVAEKACQLLIKEDLIDIDKSLWDLIYPPQEPIEAQNNN